MIDFDTCDFFFRISFKLPLGPNGYVSFYSLLFIKIEHFLWISLNAIARTHTPGNSILIFDLSRIEHYKFVNLEFEINWKQSTIFWILNFTNKLLFNILRRKSAEKFVKR